MKYLKIYENFKWDIIRICKEFGIKDYDITEDGLVNVCSQRDAGRPVNLSKRRLGRIPLNFGYVLTDFNCSSNYLTSLKGSPKECVGDFNCGYNLLQSLKFSPIICHRYFYCWHNQLTSVKGSPREVACTFYCDNNKISNLIGSPDKVKNYYFYNNQITDFEGFPENFEFITYRQQYSTISTEIKCDGNPVYEIVSLIPKGNINNNSFKQTEFIKYLIEYDVIKGNKIDEIRLDQAYFRTTGKELEQNRKVFYGYTLV